MININDAITTTVTTPILSARPNFCSDCGVKLRPAGNYCANCGAAVQAIGPVWLTWNGIGSYGSFEQRCMFDGLPPGVYNLTCPCPKCTPQC